MELKENEFSIERSIGGKVVGICLNKKALQRLTINYRKRSEDYELAGNDFLAMYLSAKADLIDNLLILIGE